ncbi:MAG: acyl-CoA thioesterase [Nevskia sp.]|jgi:acyl-CoA thioester hydrolase|nr:acyl-CoA thioesterase [Nevskia sp.]MCK9385452.1 acyl-CoA thioesterase [Nevskia sp.]
MSEIALQWEHPRPFVNTLVVRPEDTDAMGHTNNVVYLGWLEAAAWGHSHALGMSIERYRELNAGCVVRRHELEYMAATFAGETLAVGTWIDENDGRLGMWRAYQVIRPADGRTVMRARTLWVCVDMKTGKPRRQPPEFLAVYMPDPIAAD